VIGAVQRATGPESHRHVRRRHHARRAEAAVAAAQGGYHMEYGYSCMGYEIAGAMGLKLARPTAR
jgi:3D-(3,5/4)-trihydroxycyclohexane-1,2-dione acylhydrolase (decyclizing)